MTTNHEGIIINNLIKSYGKHIAVNNISFEVQKGEIFSLLGLNGAGKSTTVKILSTLALPTSGSVWVGGYDVVKDPEKVRTILGVALQEIGLDPLMTAKESLMLQARLFGMRGRQVKKRASELLSMVGLDHVANQLVRSFSGGMRRRLDLALAIVHQPAILVLDEPTTGLDAIAQREIREEILRMNKEQGMTIVLITHDLVEADTLTHRVAIIDKGEIVRMGTPSQLKAKLGPDLVTLHFQDQYTTNYAKEILQSKAESILTNENSLCFHIQEPVKELANITDQLQQKGNSPTSLSIAHPTLEDVFLQATGYRFSEENPQK